MTGPDHRRRPDGDDTGRPSRRADSVHEAGLCGSCRYAVTQTSAKGSVFWRCRRAELEPGWLRYPPIPVRHCPGHRPVERATGDPNATRGADNEPPDGPGSAR